MKKNIKKIFTIVLLLMIFTTNNTVKAVESGGSIGGSPGGATGGGGAGGNAPTRMTMGYRVSVVKYISGSKKKPEKIFSKTFVSEEFSKYFTPGQANRNGVPVFYLDSNPKTEYSKNSKLNWKQSDRIPGYQIGKAMDKNGNIVSFKSNENWSWENVVRYFDTMANPNNTVMLQEYLKDEFGFALQDDPTKCSDIYYYYLLVEPMLLMAQNRIASDPVYFGTSTELSFVWSDQKNFKKSLSTFIYTPTTNFKLSGHNVSFDYFGSGVGNNPTPTNNIVGQNGYGVGTLWIGHLYNQCEVCYVKKTTGGNLTCTNVNQNNTASFYEEYTKEVCSDIKSEDERNKAKTNTQYGKKIKETDNCTLYCIESAFASFPGNIKNTIDLGDATTAKTYFAWPGIKDYGATNLMKMSSTLECTMVPKTGKSCANETKTLKENAIATIKNPEVFKFEATITGGDNKALTDVSLNSYIDETSSTTIENNKFSVTREVYLKIPYGKNQLYNKETNEVNDCNVGTCVDTDIINDRGEGVISYTLSDDKKDKPQELHIKNVKLGSNNLFGHMIAEDYACTYQFTYGGDSDEPTTCIGYDKDVWSDYKSCYLEELKKCNTGTKTTSGFRKLNFNFNVTKIKTIDEMIQDVEKNKSNEDSLCAYSKCKGILSESSKTKIDLTSCIGQKQQTGMTKEKARAACESEKCSLCKSSYGVIYDLTKCMSTGNSYTICKYLYCPSDICPNGICDEKCSNDCKWTFDRGSSGETKRVFKKICSGSENCGELVLACPGGDTKMKDPTSCIKDQLKYKLNGMEIEDGLTKKIINANDIKSAFAACQENVCPAVEGKIVYRTIDLNNPFPGKVNDKNVKEFCNGNCKGRMPGENWNSVEMVKQKILNARNRRGYELYNADVEPIYEITLTPSVMKEIREYNKKTKYSDFNLTCTTQDKDSKCISKFLHGDEQNAGFNKIITGGRCKNIDAIGFDECYREDK